VLARADLLYRAQRVRALCEGGPKFNELDGGRRATIVRREEAADRGWCQRLLAVPAFRRRCCSRGAVPVARACLSPRMAVVVPDVRPAVPVLSGRIEMVLANGRRVIVDGGVDIAVLSHLVEALERR
jgi:hypothetical protein